MEVFKQKRGKPKSCQRERAKGAREKEERSNGKRESGDWKKESEGRK
jgi:hypothetical protein